MFRIMPTVRLLVVLLTFMAVGLLSTPLPAADEVSAVTAAEGADAAKQQILDSETWRETLRRLERWFSVQVIYGPPEVAQLREQFRDNVQRMSATELAQFQQELQDKLDVLERPEAAEARAWARAYLQAASESRAAEFRKRLPDVVRMSAAQLEQALQDNQRERAQAMASRRAFDQLRNQQVTAIRQMQQQQAEASARATQAATQSAGTHPGFDGGQYAPRRYNRYPGTFWGPRWGWGWGGWGW
jgi:hypothetical protein